jgi:putative SOS response-associated peptidase YedK
MCGRYTLIRLADFTDMFPWIRGPETQPPARYNVAPTQDIPVVANEPNPHIDFFHWGLVPPWAKDISIGNRMINARVETLNTKPVFRTALKRRRCIVPASGFYEWKKSPDGKTKTPMYIRMKGSRPFAFAGLWETWHSPDGSKLRSCTLITGSPNELLSTIHDRMPMILKPEDYQRWLDPHERDPADLMPLLTPYPAEKMEAFPVSRAVNNASNDVPGCIEPLAAPEDPPLPQETLPNPKKGTATRRKQKVDQSPSLFE